MLYKIAYGFIIGIVIKTIIGKLLKIETLLIFYINPKFLYSCLVKLGTT